jgi:MFS family permease
MQQRSLQQVRVSVSLIFLIHGLIIATWASRIPAFQAHLHLSPAVLGRSLMMAAIGSVLAMPAAGWLINKFGSLSIVIGSTLGFGLALPLIAESNTVLTLSVALLFYGAMAGSMDVAMNTHAVMLEKRYQSPRSPTTLAHRFKLRIMCRCTLPLCGNTSASSDGLPDNL